MKAKNKLSKKNLLGTIFLGRTNEWLQTDHVISGPMRGLEENCTDCTNTQTHTHLDMATNGNSLKFRWIKIFIQNLNFTRAVKLKISWEEWDYCFHFSSLEVLDFVNYV